MMNGNGYIANGHGPPHQQRYSDGTTVQDLEETDTEAIETISKHVGNGVAHSVANGVQHMANGFKGIANGHGPVTGQKAPTMANGFASGLPKYANLEEANGRRQMYNEVNYMDGHI